MMMMLVWLGLAVFGGIALVIVVPWTAARIVGPAWIDSVANAYVWLAQTAATKSAIVERDGTLELVSKRFDSEIRGDKDQAHGDERHHRDSFGVLSRLENKSFGLALSDRSEYVSPLLAEIGQKAWRRREEGDLGKKSENEMDDGIRVPKASQLVTLRHAKKLTTGSSSPESGHESYLRTKISQEKFNERVSFGQGIMIVLGFLGSCAALYWMTSQGVDTAPATNSTTVSLLALLAGTRSRLWNGWMAIYRRRDKIAAVAYIALWLLAVPVVAFWIGGLLIGALVTVGLFSVAMVIPGGIALLGPAIPKSIGLVLARGLWILAQLTVGRGVLVRRETGAYEYSRLQDAPEDADHAFETDLSDGTTLEINGSRGDLYRFGWAPFGITEEKGPANMDPITGNPPTQLASDGGESQDPPAKIRSKNSRQGYHAILPIPKSDEWLVTLPQLYSWCKETAESEPIERGRDKALSDHGGEQQIGTLHFFGSILGAMLLGGVFGFLAGGGI